MAKKQNTVSDEAVLKATGKAWPDWFVYIDNLGGKDLDHKGIVALLKERTDINAWWQQMVTVEYEKARGMRKEHQMVDGFQISKSKTIAATADVLFQAWMDEKERQSWLDDPAFTIRKSTPSKTIRITWVNGESHVNVSFYPKKEKTQVSINHGKLPDASTAEQMKSYWARQLQQLAARYS